MHCPCGRKAVEVQSLNPGCPACLLMRANEHIFRDQYLGRHRVPVSSCICDRPLEPSLKVSGPVVQASIEITDEASTIVHGLRETQRTDLAC